MAASAMAAAWAGDTSPRRAAASSSGRVQSASAVARASWAFVTLVPDRWARRWAGLRSPWVRHRPPSPARWAARAATEVIMLATRMASWATASASAADSRAGSKAAAKADAASRTSIIATTPTIGSMIA